MSNLQIIFLGTAFSVAFIESILLNIRLKKALDAKESNITIVKPMADRTQKGFMDFKTGRQVEINPRTRREEFID